MHDGGFHAAFCLPVIVPRAPQPIQHNTQSDVRHSLRPYEAFAPHNDAVDDNTLAEVDAEEAEIVFNGSIRFRYSEILFALDREAYADIITSISEVA